MGVCIAAAWSKVRCAGLWKQTKQQVVMTTGMDSGEGAVTAALHSPNLQRWRQLRNDCAGASRLVSMYASESHSMVMMGMQVSWIIAQEVI